MSVKNWNFFYKKEEISLKEKIVSTISLWVAIGLLWCSFCFMMTEHFSQFVQIDWRLLCPWLFALWISYDWPEKYLKKGSLVVRALSLAVPVGYAMMNYEKIIDGLMAALEIYYPYINRYYQTGFVIQGGTQADIPAAMTFIVMVYWLFCWLLAYGTGKKVGLALFPALPLVLELVVGLAPVGNGLLVWFLAVFILLTFGGGEIRVKLFALAGVLFALVCTGGIFKKQIGYLATKEQKQAVLDWQEGLLYSDFWNNSILDVLFDREVLRNQAPNYTGRTVLEITSTQRPVSSLYLRGFYATEYENSVWRCDTSAFSAACKDAGKAEQEVAKMLFQLPFDQMEAYYAALTGYPGIGYIGQRDYMADYTIKTAGIIGNTAYVPYVSDYESFDETYVLKGDYFLEKSIFDHTVEVSAAYNASEDSIWKSISAAIERGLYGENEKWMEEALLYSSYEPLEIDLGERQKELEWYNALAKEYLWIPEDMEFIADAAEDVSSLSMLGEGDIILSFPMGITSSMQTDTSTSNTYKLLMANSVANYLAEQMSYSLLLDELPKGTDPIEYALTESHEGYCMHFASAATLLLRELDVPARYVSGYVVTPFAFEETEDGYYANVTDYAAHAWVEIYLDYIGWIPIEVTPGYNSNSSLPSQRDPEKLEELSDKQREELKNENTEEAQTTEEESESETLLSTEDIQTEEVENTQTKEENTENGVGIGGFGSGNGSNIFDIRKIFGILALIVSVVVFLCVFQSQRKRKNALLEDEIKKGQTRKAVKLLHQRIWFLLRLHSIGKTKQAFLMGNCQIRNMKRF